MNKVNKVLKANMRETTTLVMLIIVIAIFSCLSPRYLEVGNLTDIIEQATTNGFLALGITCVIITGGIDLSIGPAMAVVIVATGEMIVAGVPYLFVIAGGLLMGCAIGFINGFLVTKMRLQPFIATLGMQSVLRGVAYLITGGQPVLGIPNSFRRIFQMQLIPYIRMSIIYLIVLAIIYQFVLKKRKTGIYIYAIGANEEATKLSGVKTDRYKIIAYMMCGIGAALAGMLTLARLGSGEPTAGQGYEVNAIASAAIGGASLAGGKGSIIGTILGALVLSSLKIGLIVIGMDTFYQYIAIGLIIILAVYFETIQEFISKQVGKRRKK